jgi:hypothetical protein
VTDHAGQRPMAERRGEGQHVAHPVQRGVRRQVLIESDLRPAASAVAALVWRHHVIPGIGQRQHHLAPAVAKLWKAVHEEQPAAARCFEPGVEHVHRDPVHAGHDARADACRQSAGAKGRIG